MFYVNELTHIYWRSVKDRLKPEYCFWFRYVSLPVHNDTMILSYPARPGNKKQGELFQTKACKQYEGQSLFI